MFDGKGEKDHPATALPQEGWIPLDPVAKKNQSKKTNSYESQHSLVGALAREYTNGATSDTMSKPVFEIDDPLSPLNPHGEKFNARAWATNVAEKAQSAGQGFRKVGLSFENLNVFGYGTPTDFQKNVGNVWLALPSIVGNLFHSNLHQTRIDILRQFDGLIRPGEMCVVLGPPGSGCSTFLKTVSGETNGIYVSDGSSFNYHGLSAKEMHGAHRGEAIYTADVDTHFPLLTVGETLTFASRARCQRALPDGIQRDKYVKTIPIYASLR